MSPHQTKVQTMLSHIRFLGFTTISTSKKCFTLGCDQDRDTDRKGYSRKYNVNFKLLQLFTQLIISSSLISSLILVIPSSLIKTLKILILKFGNILGIVYTNASFLMQLRLLFTRQRSRTLAKPGWFENAAKSGAFSKRYVFICRVNGETHQFEYG